MNQKIVKQIQGIIDTVEELAPSDRQGWQGVSDQLSELPQVLDWMVI